MGSKKSSIFHLNLCFVITQRCLFFHINIVACYAIVSGKPIKFPFLQNKDVTEAIQKVAAAYDCKIVEGVLSHQLKQFVIDGNKVILSVSNPETRVDDAEFEENEVYAIDIVTSTGEGKVIHRLQKVLKGNSIWLLLKKKLFSTP